MAFKHLSILLVLLAVTVSANVIRDSEAGLVRNEEPVRALPAFDQGQGLDGIYFDDVTSKRPDITDIFGGIFQGLVKAPGQIANRVQGIIEGILRRPSTPAPKRIVK